MNKKDPPSNGGSFLFNIKIQSDQTTSFALLFNQKPVLKTHTHSTHWP